MLHNQIGSISSTPLLEIKNLCASFAKEMPLDLELIAQNLQNTKIDSQRRDSPQIVLEKRDSQKKSHPFCLRDIHLTIKKGQALGLAGESGSGKSLLARIIMGLQADIFLHSGEILFHGENLLALQGYHGDTKIPTQPKHTKAMQKILGKEIAYIPQDPLSALNPLHTIYKQIEESLHIHKLFKDRGERKAHILSLCSEVGLHEDLLYRYPHELSGGQRQRAIIVLALVAKPQLLICDEPTTALDISLSMQVIELLRTLSIKHSVALLFITHDLGLLRLLCDTNIIMQHGCIVEILTKDSMPQHTYTKELFSAHKLEKKIYNTAQNPIIMQLQDFSVGVKKSNLFGKKFSIITKKINLTLQEGKTLGIIGESGSGKSTLAQGILHLMETHGIDMYFGRKLSCDGNIDKKFLKEMRQNMQIVFQDSTSALNPRFRVKDLVAEGLKLQKESEEKIMQTIENIFDILNLDRNLLNRYPSELSGGQRQRVAIARAMVLYPKILVLDEPTSALDKVVQKNTLELLQSMQERYNLSYILITHDLSVVANLCDDVAVLSNGEIIEYGNVESILSQPQHEYTKNMVAIHSRTHAV